MAYSPPGGARHLSLAEREAWAVGRGPGLCWEDQSGPQRGQKSWCQDMLFLCVTCPATGLRFGEANPALGLHGSALACPPPWSLLHPLSIRGMSGGIYTAAQPKGALPWKRSPPGSTHTPQPGMPHRAGDCGPDGEHVGVHWHREARSPAPSLPGS